MRSIGPIASSQLLCITGGMADVEAHEYRVGSPASSIVGIAEGLMQRDDLNDELVTHLRAIRDLALEIVVEAERSVPPRSEP